MSEFHDAALMLVGHGSTVNGASTATVYQHAAELRRRGLFAEVREGFWKVDPRLASVLAELSARRVFIVPLFTSEGYFTRQIIPRELGLLVGEPPALCRMLRQGRRTIHYCEAVGTHPAMTGLILKRAREALAAGPPPSDCALLIAGHGTGLNPASRRALERQVAVIAGEGQFAEVHAVFIEEPPTVAEAYTLTSAPNLVVVPFFMSDGLHVAEDLPVMLGEAEGVVRERLRRGVGGWLNPTERHGRRVWLTPSVGNDPSIADVILEGVTQAARAGGLDPTAAAASTVAAG